MERALWNPIIRCTSKLGLWELAACQWQKTLWGCFSILPPYHLRQYHYTESLLWTSSISTKTLGIDAWDTLQFIYITHKAGMTFHNTSTKHTINVDTYVSRKHLRIQETVKHHILDDKPYTSIQWHHHKLKVQLATKGCVECSSVHKIMQIGKPTQTYNYVFYYNLGHQTV